MPPATRFGEFTVSKKTDSPMQLSRPGFRQILSGEIVMNPNDRLAIARILRALVETPAAIASIRAHLLSQRTVLGVLRPAAQSAKGSEHEFEYDLVAGL